MSKDIRSFFLPKGQKSEKPNQESNDIKKSKKRPIIIDSDSDESVEIIPKKKKENTANKKSGTVKKRVEILKPVDASDLFGSEKIKRSEAKPALVCKESKNKSKSPKECEQIHFDDDFEATLCQIDQLEDEVLSKNDVHKNVPDGKETKPKISPDGSKPSGKTVEKKQNSSPEAKEKKHYEKKLSENKNKEVVTEKDLKKETPKKAANLNESLGSPADPVEKKRQQALSYMKYLQRGGPKHLGSKEVPKGKAGCLSGLVFVITGVLDSLEREEAAQIIEQYGGKVTGNVSRNTSYLIRGEDAGQSKLNKAEALGTSQINEDGLFDLIRTRSDNTSNESHPTPEGIKKKKKHEKTRAEEDSIPSKKAKVESKVEPTETKKSIESKKVSLEDKPSVESKQKSEWKSSKNKTSTLDIKNQNYNSENKTEKETKITADFADVKSSLWVDKYKPTKTKQVIGQQGDKSSLKKLTVWLENWHKNHSGNKKHVKPSPWAKNDDGAFFKAALLSGPPGIGKTTMAHLVSKELGFDVVEFNASDTRSKKLLHMEISELLSSKSLFGFCHLGDTVHQTSIKHVLLMDEVDGMAGNEDRGGVQELIQLIKNTRVPIICMCNDRNHPKIRSLANYCFDLRVMKPRLEQIKGAMMSVCYKEGLKIASEALNDIICGANFDIRQILHHLSLWSVKEKQFPSGVGQAGAPKPHKDMKMGPWDVVRKVFSAEEHKTMSIHDKSDLFFHDYSINPLFVQENYLSVVPAAAKGCVKKTLECIAATAESISVGDVVEKTIRSRGAWSLLPTQAMFSSVIPGDLMEGYMRGQINFPSWLGKNSRTGKLDRLLQELHVHTRLSISGSKQALNLEYLPHIRDAILRPLTAEGSVGVPETLNVLQTYNLLREDLESILELTAWPNQKDPMSGIESKVKAALTRAYNKEGILTPYSVVNVVKKRSAGTSPDLEDFEEGGEEEEVDEDDVSVDAMIKAKKSQKRSEEVPAKGPQGRGKGGNGSNSRGGQKRGRGRGK
ncbi:hypothetical protein R5R35_006700 [Gryllus longicercus]|uniref:Replication factor C subunit 1 n=1 Tax=Gryllus longicercus TaxID=2509291 RepID=A0AAN9VWD8_9ORTH